MESDFWGAVFVLCTLCSFWMAVECIGDLIDKDKRSFENTLNWAAMAFFISIGCIFVLCAVASFMNVSIKSLIGGL